MAINTQELFDLKASKFSTDATSEQFTEGFFYALTRVVEDLNSKRIGPGLGIASVPEALDENIAVSSAYFGVVSAGVDLYLKDTGEWGQQTRQDAEAIYDRALRKAQTQYFSGTSSKTRLQAK